MPDIDSYVNKDLYVTTPSGYVIDADERSYNRILRLELPCVFVLRDNSELTITEQSLIDEFLKAIKDNWNAIFTAKQQQRHFIMSTDDLEALVDFEPHF